MPIKRLLLVGNMQIGQYVPPAGSLVYLSMRLYRWTKAPHEGSTFLRSVLFYVYRDSTDY